MCGSTGGRPNSALDADIATEIHQVGAITVARFMELALYHPQGGYYAATTQRSGKAGDFYTSVDAGPVFGAMLARLSAAAWHAAGEPASFDLVEVGAGNGRLARDLLDALARHEPRCYESIRVTLVERSPAARQAHDEVLSAHRARLHASQAKIPAGVRGLVYANELLDAFPVHRVRMTANGLVEVFVAETNGRLALVEGPLSTPRLPQYFEDIGVTLPRGAAADISVAALDWCREAASALERGHLLLIDYGHDARTLYGGLHPTGTLRAFAGHQVDPPPVPTGDSTAPAWLQQPGRRDLTAHVDFTSVEGVLTRAGLHRAAFVDQTRFLLALGLADVLRDAAGPSLAATRRRLAASTLVSPEGLGGTHHALLMATPSAPPLQFPFERPWEA